jgi:hypothetical protein
VFFLTKSLLKVKKKLSITLNSIAPKYQTLFLKSVVVGVILVNLPSWANAETEIETNKKNNTFFIFIAPYRLAHKALGTCAPPLCAGCPTQFLF